MQTSNAADTLALEVNAALRNGALEVSYALTNRSSQSIIAFDGAPGIGGGAFPDLTGQCYISYSDGIVHILRIRPGPHPTKDTTRIFMPAGSEIAPQETRRVQFGLSLPIKERAEYSPDGPSATHATRLAHQLELGIGYFFKTADTVVKPRELPGAVQVVRAAPLSQTYQISRRCAVDVEIQIRTDPEFLRMSQ